jgi:hypothetical protein
MALKKVKTLQIQEDFILQRKNETLKSMAKG